MSESETDPKMEALAAVLDPDVFDDDKPKSNRQAAVIQWAARRYMAMEKAERAIAAGWVSPDEARAREAAARREARRGYVSRVRHEAALSTVRARLTIELHKVDEQIARVEALVDAAEKRSPIGARRDRGHPGEPASVLIPTRDLRAALAEPGRDEEGR